MTLSCHSGATTDLRGDGLITSRGKTLIINDWERLKQEGQYNPDYLHAGQKVERD